MFSNRSDVFYPKTETRLTDPEMLSLQTRYDRFDAEAELIKICQYAFKEKPLSFQRIIAWGLDHILFDVKLKSLRVVIRINNTTVEDDYFEVEKFIYELLMKNNIQHCKVYNLVKRGKDFPYDFLILDRLLDGDFEKLLENGVYTVSEETSILLDSGRLLRKIHSIKSKNYGFFSRSNLSSGLVGEKESWKDYFLTAFEENVFDLKELAYINDNKAREIVKTINDNTSLLEYNDPRLLHGDYCDHNIISNKTKIVGAIDWTDAISGDPLHDIAFWFSFYSKERLKTFLQGYYADDLRPKNFFQVLNLYLLRINVSKAVLRHKYGIKNKVPLAIDKIDESIKFLNK